MYGFIMIVLVVMLAIQQSTARPQFGCKLDFMILYDKT